MKPSYKQPLIVRAIDRLSDFAGVVALALVVPLVALSAGNAIVRYAFNYSSNGLLEIQWYLFSAIFLLGASYALKHNSHVRIDIILHRFSPRGQALIDLITLLLFLLPFACLLTWMGWPFFATSFTEREMSSDVGGLIRWPVKILVPLGMALLALQGVSEILKRVNAIRTGDYPAAQDQSPVPGMAPADRAEVDHV